MASVNVPVEERTALTLEMRECVALLHSIDKRVDDIGGNARTLAAAHSRIEKTIESIAYLEERMTERPTKTDVKEMLKDASPEQLVEIARVLSRGSDAPEDDEQDELSGGGAMVPEAYYPVDEECPADEDQRPTDEIVGEKIGHLPEYKENGSAQD